ncbi:hypothetical protein HanRHA438_Chr04g0190641 [Helianthus annuus]|nr:hypothetical protein HanRHA438_Chr04g0190641 [Helianthus annuus]
MPFAIATSISISRCPACKSLKRLQSLNYGARTFNVSNNTKNNKHESYFWPK